jgi:hypothetical protein
LLGALRVDAVYNKCPSKLPFKFQQLSLGAHIYVHGYHTAVTQVNSSSSARIVTLEGQWPSTSTNPHIRAAALKRSSPNEPTTHTTFAMMQLLV